MTKDIALASLVEDERIYPRNHMDDMHVADLVRAIAAGSTLPPIIAEESTLRVVDGIHRLHALRKFFGDETIQPVELRTYDSDAALFLEAVALNSVHGRKLDRHDQTRIVLKLREFGIADEQISVTLHVPEPILEKLALRIVIDQDDDIVPSKRGLEHLRGQKLSQEQIDAINSVRSAEIGRICRELVRLLEARVVDLQNPLNISNMRQLVAVINASLESVAV